MVLAAGEQFRSLQMKCMNNLVIVAGSGRNVGKTEFVCGLIRNVSSKCQVYGLKVSAVYPDEKIYHGCHGNTVSEPLVEETRVDLDKDSARMLRAGAQRVFYLRAEDAQIKNGFEQFLKMVPDGAPVVCESGSLSKIVRPGLLVLVTRKDVQCKPRSAELIQSVSLIVHSDGTSGFPELGDVDYSGKRGWYLRGGRPDQ